MLFDVCFYVWITHTHTFPAAKVLQKNDICKFFSVFFQSNAMHCNEMTASEAMRIAYKPLENTLLGDVLLTHAVIQL